MKPLKVRLSITLDNDLVEEFRQLADEDARPLSQYINLVLRSHLRKTKKKQGRT